MSPSPPPATRALILINIAVSLLQQLLPNLMAGLFALWPPHSGLFEPWQLITYAFLHAQWAHGGWAHLFFNMFALFMFGSALEDRKSTRLNSSHGYISYAVFCLKKNTELLA